MLNNKQSEENINTEENFPADDDLVFEPNDENSQQNSFSGDIKKIRDDLKKCVAEKQEYLDGWQRAKADLINSKREFEEGRKSFVAFAKSDLIVQILPVLDSFDMAFKNTEGVPANWLKGVEYIYNQMISVLGENGVKQINPLGEKFDINKHTSVEVEKVDDESQESIILGVIQKGYELNGKVLREAKVKVGEFKK